jgi:hypothetical protein
MRTWQDIQQILARILQLAKNLCDDGSHTPSTIKQGSCEHRCQDVDTEICLQDAGIALALDRGEKASNAQMKAGGEPAKLRASSRITWHDAAPTRPASQRPQRTVSYHSITSDERTTSASAANVPCVFTYGDLRAQVWGLFVRLDVLQIGI